MCPSGRSQQPRRAPPTYKPAFDIIDTDRDGKISHEDLRHFYDEFFNVDEDMIGSMMSVADVNKDGYIEYEEFERVLVDREMREKRHDSVLEDVFRVMDKDGDGKVSFEDLKEFMKLAGLNYDDEGIKSMIMLACGNQDGDGVSFDCLVKILGFDNHFGF